MKVRNLPISYMSPSRLAGLVLLVGLEWRGLGTVKRNATKCRLYWGAEQRDPEMSCGLGWFAP